MVAVFRKPPRGVETKTLLENHQQISEHLHLGGASVGSGCRAVLFFEKKFFEFSEQQGRGSLGEKGLDTPLRRLFRYPLLN
jgi:hypothetical protein